MCVSHSCGMSSVLHRKSSRLHLVDACLTHTWILCNSLRWASVDLTKSGLKKIILNAGWNQYLEISTKPAALCARKISDWGHWAKPVKHVIQMRELRQARYLSTPSPAYPRPPPATQLSANAVQVPGTATATQGIIDVAMGSAPTLRAEILWTLHTVVKQQSYNSNEGIWQAFFSLVKEHDCRGGCSGMSLSSVFMMWEVSTTGL